MWRALCAQDTCLIVVFSVNNINYELKNIAFNLSKLYFFKKNKKINIRKVEARLLVVGINMIVK